MQPNSPLPARVDPVQPRPPAIGRWSLRLKQLKPKKSIAGHRAETFLLDKMYGARGRLAALQEGCDNAR
jgi:hypothetical protein